MIACGIARTLKNYLGDYLRYILYMHENGEILVFAGFFLRHFGIKVGIALCGDLSFQLN